MHILFSLQKEAKSVSLARSVVVEGLPTDKSKTSIDSVTQFFAGQGATVHYVKLLHKRDKDASKGSERELNGVAFVELGDTKEAEAYIAKVNDAKSLSDVPAPFSLIPFHFHASHALATTITSLCWF